eukprot:TRINITY_DN39710_c0_g1_i1.p1 TRINITY_DN39710_c0_g1~~TRINITY_DN39710_c0_g1_i1.p1  ORF type:complete len:323 (+),score=37.85 TRINITY_DN39710_c0_g1_i1:57-1025(+)
MQLALRRLKQKLLLIGAVSLLLKLLKWRNKKRFAQMLARSHTSTSQGGQLWQQFKNSEKRQSLPELPTPITVQHISLAGGGFRTISYIGHVLFLKHCKMLDATTKFYGASLGAFFAVVLAFETAGYAITDELVSGSLDYCICMRKQPLMTWGLLRNIFRRLMNDHLPDTLSCINGRVHISLTYLFPTPHNVLISEFHSKSDLIDCVLASMHVPGWTRGISPVTTFRGRLCVDGGFTWNEPSPTAAAPAQKQRSLYREVFPSSASLRTLPASASEWHYKCKEHRAPLWQVFRPPPVECFLEEMEKGWQDAQRAAERRISGSAH